MPWDQQETPQPQSPTEESLAAAGPLQSSSGSPPGAHDTEPEPASTTGGAGSGLSLVEVRRLWPDIVDATKTMRRLVWMLLTQHAQVVSAEGDAVTIGFDTAGPRESFVKSGGDEVLRQAAIDVVGQDWRVEAIVDPGAGQGDAARPPARSQEPDAGPPEREQPEASAEPVAPVPSTPAPPPGPPTPAPGSTAPAPSPQAPAPSHVVVPEEVHEVRQAAPSEASIAPGAETPHPRMSRPEEVPEPSAPYDRDDAADPDDPEADSNGHDSADLLERTLGARVIEEIPHE